MAKNKSLSHFPPLVFNVFKPARFTSYDVIRHFKRHLPEGFGKIGHFGTLDPFASGVMLVGIAGAARLNDFVHDFYPKTYLAVGKLGIETATGDWESEVIQKDESLFLKREIAGFSRPFLEQRFRDQFLGEYWQAPHKFSASKFMGKNLHQWAREGIEVKKEAVKRHIFDIQVVKFEFPYLSVRVTVSSGTYVRTLFNHLANELGTIGSLIALNRESIGHVTARSGLFQKDWPLHRGPFILTKGIRVDDLLPFDRFILNDAEVKSFKNGAFLRPDQLVISQREKMASDYFWMCDEKNSLLGLGQRTSPHELRPKINFYSMAQDAL
jgi:tRNA pseudouridine55 synthase